ncbi:hypothetical protein QBC46DRAFT_259902 [Diplogelasinospora grovesii]|uniref:Clr5 domain-containing protein n=1 Tax=Diplogelasinospora grovesii TaxID=303347 RepID=A0AAN6N849_9PEZI|nr:hypothetical protein QBC46DRAFT_259902 [Diplogelasinospora grovesii]
MGSPLTIGDEEKVPGLTFDSDEAETVFVKEESESPPADDKRLLVTRERPFKHMYKGRFAASGVSKRESTRPSLTHQQITKASRAISRSTASSSLSSHRPNLTGKVKIPRTPDDWEPFKEILTDLYITQNRILRDVIVIMETEHDFRATPKMFKNQFSRWNIFKYNVKNKPRLKSKAGSPEEGPGDQDMDLMVLQNHATIDSFVSPMMHQNGGSRAMQAGLTAVRHYLHGLIDTDPAQCKQDVVVLFDDPCYRYFKVAMDLFDARENVQGGRVLRLAFLQIERKIMQPNIKSFSDLCFLVPHLLLESNRQDILAAYLQYLARLATLRFGNHPFTEIVASFAELLHRPEDIMRYIMILSQINSDTIDNLGQMLERTRMWARNQYLACQRTVDNGTPLSQISRDPHEHYMIRLEAQSVYWAQHLLVHSPESDELAEQWLHRNFSDDFAPRCEALLEDIKAKIAAGHHFPKLWERMLECLYCGWLNDYYETQQDWPRVFEWGRRGLDLSTNEQFIIWAIHLEDLMRQHGTVEEAEEMRRRRIEHEWLESVRLQVDRLTLS